VTRVAPGAAAAGMHGFAAALTSFVGRAGEVGEVAGLLAEARLVTVTGPGGVGKTRLAAEVAQRVTSLVADGVWLAELASVSDPALVATAVAAALGVPPARDVPVVDSLAAVLARQQLLLVLDNCEHLLAAVAELCAALLPAADDVRILATSREPIGIDGEARYRLAPLSLTGPRGQAGLGTSEAVALFAERARRVDPHFTLGGEPGQAVARLVERLDGMPLAIELAAARVEALSAADLLNRLDDNPQLLATRNRLAAERHQSLAATAAWSYRLLTGQEQRVFCWLAVFPGPFTLGAAEAVAGANASTAVLHLVDCSLLTAPRPGPDGRDRYLMLETLRGYAAERLAAAGEQPMAAAKLAGYALTVAEQAAHALETSAGELPAAAWLDAEDATVHQSLDWALEHDPAAALSLAISLARWWILRGRQAAGYAQLSRAAEQAPENGTAWCEAQFWLGNLAMEDRPAVSLDHFTRARDVLLEHGPRELLVRALNGRAGTLVNLGGVAEAAQEAHRALILARQVGYPAGEARALFNLHITADYSGDADNAVAWARQAQRIDPATISGTMVCECNIYLATGLVSNGEHEEARQYCADALTLARRAGYVRREAECLHLMADIELAARQLTQAQAFLRQAIELGLRQTDPYHILNCLDTCGYLCAQTGRHTDALTVWAAYAAVLRSMGIPDNQHDSHRRQQPLHSARLTLGTAIAKAAEDRGTTMTSATATEYALLLMTSQPQHAQDPPATGLPRLSTRERELVTLVAQGRTNAQIAGQLFISVRTVGSHLDRIRDKTGCRRRADLTRLALQAGLV
jgi:predicted ATPase/DNA-binding CsgD family transcriptional regulator